MTTAATGPAAADAESDLSPFAERLAALLAEAGAADDAGLAQAACRARLSDGLPVLAPTPERVEAMLAGRDPAEPAAGPLPISFAMATWADVAACAVLAGCAPGAAPVVAAALAALAQPAFNLLGVQATTGAASPLVVVHGPLVAELGLNAGANALGPGCAANATIGRAVRLVLQNVGVCWPGEGDMATHGHPGKYTWLVAENQPASPWPPLSVRLGGEAADRAVSVFAGVGNVEVVLPTSPERLVSRLARVLVGLAAPSAGLLLPPESAGVLHAVGWGEAELAAALEANGATPPWVLVTGGAGVKATVVPGWGGPSELCTEVLGP
ncbi:MAG: hypothetical protein ACKVWR_14890 [Acidimicrobiales bacterium]